MVMSAITDADEEDRSSWYIYSMRPPSLPWPGRVVWERRVGRWRWGGVPEKAGVEFWHLCDALVDSLGLL